MIYDTNLTRFSHLTVKIRLSSSNPLPVLQRLLRGHNPPAQLLKRLQRPLRLLAHRLDAVLLHHRAHALGAAQKAHGVHAVLVRCARALPLVGAALGQKQVVRAAHVARLDDQRLPPQVDHRALDAVVQRREAHQLENGLKGCGQSEAEGGPHHAVCGEALVFVVEVAVEGVNGGHGGRVVGVLLEEGRAYNFEGVGEEMGFGEYVHF